MAKKENEPVEVRCPVYGLLEKLAGACSCPSEFLEHVKNAKVEMLLAVRSLIDQRIETLRKPPEKKQGSKRIKVTGGK
jgi:hypothetical protein